MLYNKATFFLMFYPVYHKTVQIPSNSEQSHNILFHNICCSIAAKAMGDGLRVWLHSRRLNCEVVMPVSFSTSLVLNLFCSLIALRYCPSVSAISSPLRHIKTFPPIHHMSVPCLLFLTVFFCFTFFLMFYPEPAF